MKTFETVRDILDNTHAFHTYAAEYYKELSRDSKNERVIMLLQYMHGQEEKTSNEFAEFRQRASKSVLGTWVQITLEISTEEFFAGLVVHNNMCVDELSGIGQQVEAYLVDVFEALSIVAATGEVRDIFQNLMDMEISRKRNLSRAANSVLLDI